MRLTNLTWPKAQEYFEKNDMVLISIGSIECHGRHMPLGTDTLIPEHLLEKIEKKSDVLIAPTIPYGSCQCLAPSAVGVSANVTVATVIDSAIDTIRHFFT